MFDCQQIFTTTKYKLVLSFRKSFFGLVKPLTVTNSQHVVNIKPCSMCPAPKSPCEKHDVVACQPAPHSRDNKQICLPLLRLSSMGAAGSDSVVVVVYTLCRRDCYSSPAALSDQIKYASASLSCSPLTSNTYLGCMPLSSSHTVK